MVVQECPLKLYCKVNLVEIPQFFSWVNFLTFMKKLEDMPAILDPQIS